MNNDGATRSCPNLTSCANISWGSWKEYVGSFSVFFMGVDFYLCWVYGVIYVLEHASREVFQMLWLKSDFF